MRPAPKKIGRVTIEVDSEGWPRWTRICVDSEGCVLNEEEARDLHYAMGRIVEFLDDAKRVDISRGIIGPYG